MSSPKRRRLGKKDSLEFSMSRWSDKNNFRRKSKKENLYNISKTKSCKKSHRSIKWDMLHSKLTLCKKLCPLVSGGRPRCHSRSMKGYLLILTSDNKQLGMSYLEVSGMEHPSMPIHARFLWRGICSQWEDLI